MKNVLIAIDFSEYAQQAAMHAAEIAKLAQARLILFYAFNSTTSEEEENSCKERWVQSQLDKLARVIHKKTKASVTRLVKPGNLPEVAFEVASRVKADAVLFCLKDPIDITSSLTASSHAFTISCATHPNPEAMKPTLASLLNLPGFSNPSFVEAV